MTRGMPVAALLWLLAAVSPVYAQSVVSVQLVMAVDVSGSVNTERFALQRHGYAEAFRDPAVQAAILATPTGSIAVAMTQWTGPERHADVLGWTLIDSRAAANAVAAAIDAVPRALFGGGTSISGAIDHAMTMFPQSRWRGMRRVIDVSGDGANNRGRPAPNARDAAVAVGVVINGLPILELEPHLDEYYRHNVIGGPGAFVIAVTHYQQFATAIRNKLVVEISGGFSKPPRSARRVRLPPGPRSAPTPIACAADRLPGIPARTRPAPLRSPPSRPARLPGSAAAPAA